MKDYIPPPESLKKNELAYNLIDDSLSLKVAEDTVIPILNNLSNENRSGSLGDVGLRNKFINGGFDIWQRATSATGNGYTSADRWFIEGSGTTATSVYGNTMIVTTTAAWAGFTQFIENGARLKGKTATISFYWGIGASPDIPDDAYILISLQSGEAVNVAIPMPGVEEMKHLTIVLPTGSSGSTDFLKVRWVFSKTVKHIIVYVSKVQLELGSIATEFEERPIGLELALCQRYFEKWTGSLLPVGYINAAGALGNKVANNIAFNTTKRTRPTVTGTLLHGTFELWGVPTTHGFGLYSNQDGSATCTITGWTASSEIN